MTEPTFRVGDHVQAKQRSAWETTIYRVAAVLGNGNIVCQVPGWKPLRTFAPGECELVAKETAPTQDTP